MARRMVRWLIRETGRFIPIRSMDDNWLGRRVRIATAVILEMAPGKPRNQKTRKFRIRPVFVTGNEFKLRSHVYESLGEKEREREGKERGREKRIPVDSSPCHSVEVARPPSTLPSGKWDREGHRDRINVFVARPLFLSLDQPASQPETLFSTWKFAPTTFRQHCGHRFLVGTGEECGRYCLPLLTIFQRNSQIVDMEPLPISKISKS